MDTADTAVKRSAVRLTGGSGNTRSVQMAHPNHQIPTDAMAALVTRSAIPESLVARINAKWTSSSSPPPA